MEEPMLDHNAREQAAVAEHRERRRQTATAIYCVLLSAERRVDPDAAALYAVQCADKLLYRLDVTPDTASRHGQRG